MKIVMDTNVLVSGLLSHYGTSAQIVRMVIAGVLTVCYDSRILIEYREVLIRPKFAFDCNQIDDYLSYVEHFGDPIAAKPLTCKLPDEDDAPFLEVALAAKAKCIITGNLKHYPKKARQGMLIVSPSEFLNKIYGTVARDS